MDTAAILTEIARITGENDSTYRTTILRYLNKYYKQLEFLTSLPALIKDKVINIPSYYNDGTVSLTNGSATVTGSGTNWTSDYDGWYIKVDGYPDVGRVSSVGGVTSITLGENWNQETVSGKNYWLWQAEFLLPADFNKIISISQGETPMNVEVRSIEQGDKIYNLFYRIQAGAPRNVIIYRNAGDYDNETTTQLAKMVIMPPQDDAYQITMKYYRHLTALTDSASVYPVFDDARLDDYLIERTCSRVYLEREDSLAKTYKQEANESLLILKSYFENAAGDDDRFMLQVGSQISDNMIERVSRDTTLS